MAAAIKSILNSCRRMMYAVASQGHKSGPMTLRLRKRAEAALQQSEDRLRLIIDTIPTMAWSHRPDGALDFVNQRWMDYTGLSLEEELEDPTRAVHPEDLPGAMEKWLTCMAAGEPSEDELCLRRGVGG